MTATTNLQLPYLIAAQAQKHVTHNEALQILDSVVQLTLQSRTQTQPPAIPAEGERYAVPAGATGTWQARDGQVAALADGAWLFLVPQEGWIAWCVEEDKLLRHDGTQWQEVVTSGTVNPTPLVGINTTADATNRLAVKADAVLFSHDDVTPGNGSVQHKLNKSAAANTASMLFQTGFSGRAEFGLTGDDDWHVKVSPDGATWHEAIVVDKDTGRVGFGTNNPTGRLHVGGAINCKAETNAFGTTSIYTALVLGDIQGANDTWNGGLYAFARHDRSLEPFTGLCGWATSSSRILYYGGGGWNVPDATHHYFYTAPAYNETNNSGLLRLAIDIAGVVRPGTDNAQTFGSATYRWSAIYAANGTIQTSDARDKIEAGRLDGRAGGMVDAISPVLFRWKVGGNDVAPSATQTETLEDGRVVPKMVVTPKPGNRVHAGFFAQDVKAAMDAAGVDFGAWGLDDKSDPDSRQWVRPDQLIPVLWQALKETRAELKALKAAKAS